MDEETTVRPARHHHSEDEEGNFANAASSPFVQVIHHHDDDDHHHDYLTAHPGHLDFGQYSPMITRLPIGIIPPGRTATEISEASNHYDDNNHHATHRRGRSLSLGQEPLAVGESTPLLLPFRSPTSGGSSLLPTIESESTLKDGTENLLAFFGTDGTTVASSSDPHDGFHETEQDDINKETPGGMSLLYGIINAAIIVPLILSFGTIIYSNDAFQPYLSVLIRLTLVSGVVHQLCFSTFSSLPFAVGSVQDAGLIFLSTMAHNIAQFCQSRDLPDEAMLATATIGLGIATAILGCGLILIGKLRLAQYVQKLPTAVVGGYLAFIGWFCLSSGINIMASGAPESETYMAHQALILVLPGLVGGIGIYLMVRWIRHMAVLPTCILMVLLMFHAMLWITDTSLEEATELGWIRKSVAPPPWYDTWQYLQFDKVQWSALPSNVLTLLSMIFVVSLGSSLDVAAIELELQEPLNYNQELSMVGLSNLVSGLTGGYSGSYIFSQSIFSLRAGIKSRNAGFCLAGCQILLLIIPFPILSYVPNLFFGSLLIMIGVDLMMEWLWEVRHKLNLAEYAVCLGTFLLIHWLGVEFGILAGIVLHVLFQRLGLIQAAVELAGTATDAAVEYADAAAETAAGLAETAVEYAEAAVAAATGSYSNNTRSNNKNDNSGESRPAGR